MVIVGLLLLGSLTCFTFAALRKFNIRDKKLYAILLGVLVLHICVVLFIHYTGFDPFPGGADYNGYHRDAVEIATRFKSGNFSLENIPLLHYFPVIIGVVYTITAPAMVVGQLFLIWIVLLSVILLYLLVLEIRGDGKGFWLVGLAAIFYPSLLYFSSILLKDSLVVMLSLLGLLLSLKMAKNATPPLFVAFFVTVTALIHFRFYIGFALLFSFIVSWFLISHFEWDRRVKYGLIIIFLLGFSPQIAGLGYYGNMQLQSFLTETAITNYREVAYAPQPIYEPVGPKENNGPKITEPNPFDREDASGTGSSFTVDVNFDNKYKFIANYCLSFIYTLLGPFFWQLRYKKHLLFLLETIPWYFICAVIFYQAYACYKAIGPRQWLAKYKYTLPILLFCIFSVGAISLFISNFGIIARIRMPVLLSLITLLSLPYVWNRRDL
ncbi:MAG: hypothetical protein EXS48_01940 [Candidatus Staskawiczbacteria bacterium]|nr:hypothetical protein [Candidatus Staskawiczbacteria bacterium]